MTLTDRQLRAFSRFLRISRPLIDAAGLAAATLLLLSALTVEILGDNVATGGDLACHFWTLDLLHNHGIPEGRVKLWNPGNQFGEPRLLHYFPLPFLAMEALSHLVSLDRAFNWGTLLGFLLLPSCVYLCLRMMSLPFPGPMLAAAASTIFLLNESYSMWGGNGLSTMSGQFAHGYGLCFLLLAFGSLFRESQREALPLASIACCTALLLSHAYPALVVPLFCLLLLARAALKPPPDRSRAVRQALRCFVLAGAFSIALSAWFLLPMAANGKWMTEFIITWRSQNIWLEAFGTNYYPVLAVALLAAVWAALPVKSGGRRGRVHRMLRFQAVLWLSLAAFYIPVYYVLPALGLIDVRALPQLQLFLCIFSGAAAGLFLTYLGRAAAIVGALPLLLLALFWSDLHVRQLPTWAEWNYSGWNEKELHPELQAISKYLAGDFSMPRVLYELSTAHTRAGTIRTFEMLPYFAGRATVESVYLEATHLAPASVHLQAEVSKQPSCPLEQFPCPTYDVGKVIPRLRLMGIGQLILVTDEVRAQADAAADLELGARFGPWYVYQLKEQPRLVEVLAQQPLAVGRDGWREKFYNWFREYDATSAALVAADPSEIPQAGAAQTSDCSPQLAVQVNRMTLTTDCPGQAHLLKFAFHPAWTAKGGEPIFNVSPGFMLIFPRTETVELEFGPMVLWQFSRRLSQIALMLLAGAGAFAGVKAYRGKRKR